VFEDIAQGLTHSRELSRVEIAEIRPTVFAIPKRLRVIFKFDRQINTILFRAAWGALLQVRGIGERELAVAGEVYLNCDFSQLSCPDSSGLKALILPPSYRQGISTPI